MVEVCAAGLSWARGGIATSWAPLTLPLSGGCGLQLLCCLFQARAVLFKSIIAGNCLQPKQKQCVFATGFSS